MSQNNVQTAGTWNNITINGDSINDPDLAKFIDDGIFRSGRITIKPSGSVRIGDVKIHPSGLIQVGDIQIQGSISRQAVAARNASVSKVTSQTAARSVLSESTNRANVQRKHPTLITGKSDAQEPVPAAGQKRKLIEEINDSAKKAKTATNAPTATASHVAPAPKSIDDVWLDGQEYDNVPVYESCDQIRSKIEAHLLQPGVTKAQFCRDLISQRFGPGGPKIQSKMVDDFRKKRGATSGCTSSVYYSAYVYFERLRIAQNQPKSKHRLEMEKIWPHGVDRDRDDTNKGFWTGPGMGVPRQDAYGRWKVR